MKIAVLGWGSLLWKPEALHVKKENDQNQWFEEGPFLPIEFARISSDGRLTLVIAKQSQPVQTYYAVSTYHQLDEAILDLAIREGCGKSKIGYVLKEISDNQSDTPQIIYKWLLSQNLDAVIWTNLKPNFKDKIGLALNEDNVINYLKYIPQEVQTKAEEYIRKAPLAIKTPIRTAIQNKLDWHPII